MIKKKLFWAISAAAAAAFVTTGCATSSVGYRDAGEVRTLSRNFSRSDLQMCVMKMVDSMLSNPELQRKLREQFPGKRPTISLPPDALHNETSQLGLSEPLGALTRSIRTKLINTGVFEFIDVQADSLLQNAMQRDMVMAASSNVIETGQQAASDYELYGTLTEMREGDSWSKESYYIMNMQLINKRTGILDWADEQEIRKVSDRPVFGM
jgi:hypothetical protein